MKNRIVTGFAIALILMPCFAFFYPLFFGYETVAGLTPVSVTYAGIAVGTYEGPRYWIDIIESDTRYVIETNVSHLFDYGAFTDDINPGTTLEMLVDGPGVMGIRADGVIYLDEFATVAAKNADARGFIIFGIVYATALAAIVIIASIKKKKTKPTTSNDQQGETL
ncbi:MAG: hypothetical protein V1761_01055 [bacterium]